jgi:acetyl-CoA synthetase
VQRGTLIRKDPARWRVQPWLVDLEAARAGFSWQAVRRELLGEAWADAPDPPMNIGHLAVDRHLAGGSVPRGDAQAQAEATAPARIALRIVGEDGQPHSLDYAELARSTNRFAHALQQLGLQAGDGLFVLCSRSEPLYVAVLGALKAGCVVAPLFAAFGPEPVATRLRIAQPKVLLTTRSLYRRKVAAQRAAFPFLQHVIVIDDDLPGEAAEPGRLPPGTLDYAALLAGSSPEPVPAPARPTRASDPAFIHFTSGTTGTPKAALHVHEAALMHHATGRWALDLHGEDVFWCTADPGWVTGTSYGIVAPLLLGVTSLVDTGEFDAARWLRTLQRERVSVWYTAPTALRMLMKAGTALVRAHPCPSLRLIASVGEPLNPEVVWWAQEAFGLPVHDNWWQTETGGIMIANTLAADIKPGSMGRPLPGVQACLVRREGERLVHIDEPGVQGELALRAPWPSMFRGYLGQEERYRRCFVEGWYLSGDLARRDADGCYWFVGRADDVIKSAGHLIGPFELESVLMEHPAVAEAGVIGKPDAVVGETIKAFVVLKDGHVADDALRARLLAHARTRLGAAVAPKEIAFVAALPHTRSGKVMRRLLRARELGLPEGDTSTLEGT